MRQSQVGSRPPLHFVLAGVLAFVPWVSISVLPGGCASDDGSESKPVAADGGMGSDAGGLTFCPENGAARVHYVSPDPSVCKMKKLDCTLDQYGFDNQCGCGCIDKGAVLCPVVFREGVTYISLDPSKCPTSPVCDFGRYPFSNECGCGCTTPGE